LVPLLRDAVAYTHATTYSDGHTYSHGNGNTNTNANLHCYTYADGYC
jgi:hypothetical protein